jgi:hypothetical protein
MITPAPQPETTDPFAPPAWAPQTLDIAALLRARTKDQDGNEVGDFTDQTRPTGEQVERLILNGCADVSANVGGELPEALWAEARGVAALKAACQVESSFWPEQINTARSPWQQLWEMYQFELANLKEAAGAYGGGLGESGSVVTPSGTVVTAYQYGYGLGPWITSLIANAGRPAGGRR